MPAALAQRLLAALLSQLDPCRAFTMAGRGAVALRAMYMCAVDALPEPGQLLEFTVDGRAVCVANDQGRLSAVDNVCPHRQGPLAEGSIEDGKVLCPWHGWAFDLSTGAAEHAPAATVDVFGLELRGSEVWLALED